MRNFLAIISATALSKCAYEATNMLVAESKFHSPVFAPSATPQCHIRSLLQYHQCNKIPSFKPTIAIATSVLKSRAVRYSSLAHGSTTERRRLFCHFSSSGCRTPSLIRGGHPTESEEYIGSHLQVVAQTNDCVIYAFLSLFGLSCIQCRRLNKRCRKKTESREELD